MTRSPEPLAWGDRVAVRCAALVFAWLSVVVAVVSAAGAGVWWVLAGRADVTGAARWWPAVGFAFMGAAASVCLWGLSRVCRAICALASASRVRPDEVQHRSHVRAVAAQ